MVAMLAFAAARGAGRPQVADVWLLAAVAGGALGYAEGGRLARRMGGWQVICWALVLAAPFLLPQVLLTIGEDGLAAGADAWLGFTHLLFVSMFLGLFAWYRGLALGGVARVGQIQLPQPVLTLGWATLLLGERVDGLTIPTASLVVARVALTKPS